MKTPYVRPPQEAIEQEVLRDASTRTEASVLTVADTAVRLARGGKLIVDVGCGCQPYMGYGLLTRGHDGPATFIDWNYEPLEIHERCLRVVAAQDGLDIPPTWCWKQGSIYDAKLQNAVLVVQGMLPRWSEDETLVMPVGRDHGARLLFMLFTTGARWLVAYVVDRDRDTLLEGALLVGLKAEVIEGVSSTEWTPNFYGSLVCVELE